MTRKVERWFARNQRPLPWRDGYDPYHVWVAEVMAQQTRMDVVLGYFARFLERFPTLAALAAASDDDVTAAWSGLGYYRRARMLRDGARAVVARGTMPRSVEELMTIPGVGRYTAGAIASIAFNDAAPIVDGNVARVLARVYADDGDPWVHAEELVRAAKSPRDLNQGLMELGALLCKPRNPLCDVCPLRDDCAAFATHRVADFPRPKPKPATRQLRIALYLVTDRRGRVLMRREAGPLMNAMFHLPHGNTSLLTGAPLAVSPKSRLGKFRHTVTNRRIEFEVFAATAKKTCDYAWIDPASDFPHPSYVRKALRLAGIGRETPLFARP
ncbi:MAG TPA: A/G-specific adenine glycosylase [Thermoanaerobaculia bacterium]|nr:A/G-specific adenine glycosylase [Thermoanaerobaculia bacterium]